MILGKRKISILFIVGVIINLTFSHCGKREKINYSEGNFESVTIKHVSTGLPTINSAVDANGNIYAICKNDIWKIEPGSKKEKIIFENGIGPNQIYKPLKIIFFNGQCWVNSLFYYKFIYCFSANSLNPKLENIKLIDFNCFDDFTPIRKDKIIAVNVYWRDGLLKVYDFKTGEIKRLGKPEFIKLMLKFNVNSASVAVLNDMAYVIQSIKPEIQIFSLKKLQKIDTISLTPPFYKKIPGKYNIGKYDHSSHINWMSKWTRLHNIFVENGWIFICYRKGYEKKFYYEIINANDRKHRWFIDETDNYIYDFKIVKGTVYIKMSEENEGGISWKEAELSLP